MRAASDCLSSLRRLKFHQQIDAALSPQPHLFALAGSSLAWLGACGWPSAPLGAFAVQPLIMAVVKTFQSRGRSLPPPPTGR